MTGQDLFIALEQMTPEQRQGLEVMLSDSGVYLPLAEIKVQRLYPGIGGYITQPMRGDNLKGPKYITLKAD